MKYNSELKVLALPEYGRHIQNMVDYCKTIENREERNYCARSIIKVMHNMLPELQIDNGNNQNVYWDHLAIMSNFSLDVDYPEGTIKQEQLYTEPQPVEYPDNDIIYRHYGHILQSLIEKASEMEPGKEREELSYLIANQMKRSYATWNKPEVSDFKIFKDLYEFSDGTIELTEENCVLEKVDVPIKDAGRATKKKKKK